MLMVALILLIALLVLWGTPPAATPRTTPTGVMMDDGFPTKIASALQPGINFWEKSLTPAGIDGGDKIPTSTMFNLQWHTNAPRILMMVTDTEGTAAYEPKVLNDIQALINKNTAWCVTFPNGDTWAFWGVLQSFQPGTSEEGKQPEAKFKMYATNKDNSGLEAGPVLVSAGGT